MLKGKSYFGIILLFTFIGLTVAALAQTWGPWLSEPTWNQDGYFNKKCPYISSVDKTDRSATGCVATAMGQIVNYWRYPNKIYFSTNDHYIQPYSYDPENGYVQNEIDFFNDADEYGYPTINELNDALYNQDILYDGDQDEIAYLLFGCGITVSMNYGYSSGADTMDVAKALTDKLKYGSATADKDRSGVWAMHEKAIVENLKNKQPVQIAIHTEGEAGGHSVVVDGYNSDNHYFHVNLGWGGDSDFWYDIPNIENYDVVHTVVYDILPAAGWRQPGGNPKSSFKLNVPIPVSEPRLKWASNTSSGKKYAYAQMVVGAGNLIYVVRNPSTVGRQPQIDIYDHYGNKKADKVVVLVADAEITSLVQTLRGDLFFACQEGDDVKIYKVMTSQGQFEPQVKLVHSDGTNSTQMKVDNDDNIYVTINPLYSTGNAVVYSFLPSGERRSLSNGDAWKRTLASGDRVGYAVSGTSALVIDNAKRCVYVLCHNRDEQDAFLYSISMDVANVHQARYDRNMFGDTITTASMLGGIVGADDGYVYAAVNKTLYRISIDAGDGEIQWQDDEAFPWPINKMAMGSNDCMYVVAPKAVSKGYNNGYICALNPHDFGSMKWDIKVANLYRNGDEDYDTGHIQEIYVGSNGIILVFYSLGETAEGRDLGFRLAAVRDNGDSGEVLWDIEAGCKPAFGNGNVIYMLSVGGSNNCLQAWSIGAVGDPEGIALEGAVDNHPPSIPTTPSPADGAAEILAPSVTLSWAPVTDQDGHTVKYDVAICKVGDEVFYPEATGITETSVALISLEAGATYLWKVVACDGQAYAEGQTWSFITKAKENQTITFPILSSRTYGDADFAAGATASSGLVVTYTSSNSAVATIIAGKIHIVGAGTTTITASQSGNENWNAAAPVAKTLTVTKTALTATAENKTRSLGAANPAFTIAYAGFANGDTVAVLDMPPTATCPAAATSSAGTYPITVSGGSDGNYVFSYVAGTLTIRQEQTITFPVLPSTAYGAADFAAGATASSELVVTYASDNFAVATIVAGKIHIVGAGTATITASQSGNGDWNAAPPVAQTLTVVTPLPTDLTVSKIKVTPAKPLDATAFTAEVTVKNAGKNASLGGVLTLTPAVGAAGITRTVPALAKSKSVVLTFTVPGQTPGAKKMTATLSAVPGETKTTNNSRTANYTVTARPDFSITAVAFSPVAPLCNGIFTAYVTIRNNGGAAKAGYLDVWINYADGQAATKSVAVSMISAGKSKRVTVTRLPAGAAPGERTFRAVVDSRNTAVESDESNNVFSTTYTPCAVTPTPPSPPPPG